MVISDDRFNRSRINTVTVAAITSNRRLGELPGNLVLKKGSAGLDRASVVNVTQIASIDRGRLIERAGALSQADGVRLDDGLRLALCL